MHPGVRHGLPLFLLVFSLDCSDDGNPQRTEQITRTTYENVGSVCALRGAVSNRFTIVLRSCGNACGVTSAECNISVSGNMIEVTARAEEVVTTGPEQRTCPAVCRPLRTECAIPELPAGSYEVRYGGHVSGSAQRGAPALG
jgi:hypothetical protein